MWQYQDQDSKIREYVLKKKQQKEKASRLREQRRKKEYLTEEETSTQYRKRTRKNSARRIIADPFAPIANKENNNYSNTHSMKPMHRTTPIQTFNHNPPKHNHAHDPNVHKLVSMVTDCQSHIKSLQNQINDLQFEVKELKQNQPYSQQNNVQYNTPQNYFNHDQNISSYPNNNTMPRRHDTHSTASSTYRSNAPMQENNMKKTNMSKSLANLKLKRRRNSGPKANGYPSSRENIPSRNTRNNQMRAKCNSNRPSHREHTESAMDFVNKLNQMEDVVQEVQRIECHQCGRKFIESALQRHIKICKKVFCKKRKVFDMKSQRVDKDAKNAQNSGGDEYKLKKIRNKKKESWKAKSAMLRNAIAASKDVDSGMTSGYSGTMPSAYSYDDRVECPHCGRKFAEQTAERHIPKCRDIIAKPKRLRRKY